MEILNCEYENHQFKINQPKSVSDIIVNMKERFWDYEDQADKVYTLENMKMYESFFIEKVKNKNLNETLERAELIKSIFQQFSSNNRNDLIFKKDKKKLKLDYSGLISLATIIHRIIKSIIGDSKFPELLENLIERRDFSKIYDSEMWEGKSLMQLKSELNNVEEITFELSGAYDDEFEINYTILFYYFYKVFFQKVDKITLKLDCIQSSKQCKSLRNPYDYNNSKVKEISKNYDNLFISNFLLSCLIPLTKESLTKLKIKISESFINEYIYILGKEFYKKEYNSELMKDISLIIFKKIMKIKTISNLNFIINCLDRFLFKEMINFIGLHRNLEILELNLFYGRKYFDLRKIYLNYLRGQEFPDTDPNIMEKHGIIMYPYISKLGDEIMAVIDEDKIPDLLFPEFKRNLNTLKIILNEYIMTFKEFSLDITPYDELIKYENYNIQIILFIMATFTSIENSKHIKRLKLICSNIDYMIVSQIKRNLNKLIKPKLINFSQCINLQNLTLNMQGFSLLFDLESLPFSSLKSINLSISTKEDMKSVVSMLKNSKNKFKNLSELYFSIPFAFDINLIFNEFLNIYDYLPNCLERLKINKENIMKKSVLMKIIKKIKNHKNNLNCEIECDCPELDELLLNIKTSEEFKKIIISENPDINFDKCDVTGDFLNGTKFEFNENSCDDIIKAIIFCMNKIIKVDDKNIHKKKIFENVYKFMEKSSIKKTIFVKNNNDN